MKAVILTITLIGALTGAFAQRQNFGPSIANRSPLSGAELYRRVAAAGIEVLMDGRHTGSGWFADAGGLIVTAGHMVWEKGGKIEVMSPSIGRVDAQIVAVDRGHDLALLEIVKPDRSYSALQIAEAFPEPLAEIYLYGAPMFRHELLLTGRVARPVPCYELRNDMKCYAPTYYVTGPSPAGTSGGCWVDGQGRVVGNQSGFISIERNTVGISQVIPPEAIRRLVRTRQAPQTADMGVVIEELWEKSKDFIAKFPVGAEGVVVVRVNDSGPAQLADIKPDNLITALNGKPIRLRDDLFNYVRSKKPGDEVVVRLFQPGNPKPRQVPVILNSLAQ